MVVVKAILVPTDFSETACAAVRCAAGLAEVFGASLTLLHVVEDVIAQGLMSGVGSGASESVQDEAVRDAMAKFDQCLAAPPLNRTGVHRAVVAGDPFDGIMQYAQEHHVDLIVIGTHGRTGLAHALLGSVAERVVRLSPCPVLTVRACQPGFVSA